MTILRCAKQFDNSSSLIKKKSPGNPKTVPAPEKIVQVLQDVNSNGAAITINGQRYNDLVLKPFWRKLGRLRTLDRPNAWFQQDGATPHTTRENLDYILDKCQRRVLSWKTKHIWSPHSSNLSPPDFFLWGHAKDLVYKDKPSTIPELKQKITEVIQAIPVEICQRVVELSKANPKMY